LSGELQKKHKKADFPTGVSLKRFVRNCIHCSYLTLCCTLPLGNKPIFFTLQVQDAGMMAIKRLKMKKWLWID